MHFVIKNSEFRIKNPFRDSEFSIPDSEFGTCSNILPRFSLRFRRWSLIVTAIVLLAGSILSAQRVVHTPDGRPDLQGMWLNNTATPLERAKDFAGKPSLTDAEAREYEKRYQLDRTAALTRDTPEFELDVAGDLDTYEPG